MKNEAVRIVVTALKEILMSDAVSNEDRLEALEFLMDGICDLCGRGADPCSCIRWTDEG